MALRYKKRWMNCPLCDQRMQVQGVWPHMGKVHHIRTARELPEGIVKCIHCFAPVREADMKPHLQQIHDLSLSSALYPCPLCGKPVPHDQLDEHFKEAHPGQNPSLIGAPPTIDARAEQRLRRRSSEIESERLGARRRSQALHIEPFECGYCFKPIYQVLQKNGYYGYYDDKELNYKHQCTRWVHQEVDKE
jgi:hypothetical protein